MVRNKLKIYIYLTVAFCTVFMVQAKKTVLEPSYAWKAVPPLGLREPASIDTLYQNYSLEFIPQEVSYAYAATGNYCGSGRNMLFMERPVTSDFYYPSNGIIHAYP